MMVPSRRFHILLIGGTGICGLVFTKAAIQAGHAVTLYVRNPSKIPPELASRPGVHVIQGELGDEEGLKKAAACEADTFVSLAGPTLGERNGTVYLLPCSNSMGMLMNYSPSPTPFKYSIHS